MARYIDAEIAVEIINRFRNTTDENGKTVADAIIDILKVITPTADVQKIRHGRWIEQVKIRKDGKSRLVHWQCSLCGIFLGTSTANFCPHCGAKMDLEDE